jgi:SAM-dependent methyltransferase
MLHSREWAKFWAGTLLEVFVPWATHDLDRGLNSGRFVQIKRWILYARTARARARGDTGALQKSLFQFWRAETSDAYFDKYLDRYETWFLGPHHAIVDQLALLSGSGTYRRLIEVGCGAGQVLEHCATAMPEVQNFTGIDINPTIIARDRAAFAQNPRLQFEAADASVWLDQNTQPGTILLTYGGVMEYFAAETLMEMFTTLAQHGPAAVALVEPVDPSHDLAHDAKSHAFGQENSFSHNHEKLLLEAGYGVVFRKTLRVSGISWMMLLATAIPPKTLTAASRAAN